MKQWQRVESRQFSAPALARTSLFLFILLGFPRGSLANGSEVGFEGSSLFPLENSTIELSSENVVVELNFDDVPSSGRVKCEYMLHNLSSKPQTIVMGFLATPFYADFGEGERVKVAQRTTRQWAWVRLPVTMAPLDKSRWKEMMESPPDSMPTWPLEFEANEVIELTVSYPVEPLGEQYAYHARPGALWAGPIFTARVEFKLGSLMTQLLQCLQASECTRVAILPGGYEWTSEGLVWRFREWEPTEDPKIAIEWDREK